MSTTRLPLAVRTRRSTLIGVPEGDLRARRRPRRARVRWSRGPADRAGLKTGGGDHGRDAEVAAEVVAQQRLVGHVGARAVLAPQQSLLLQERDRRADRGARDAQAPGQLGLAGESVAGRDTRPRRTCSRRSSASRWRSERRSRPPSVPAAYAGCHGLTSQGLTTILSTSPARIRPNALGRAIEVDHVGDHAVAGRRRRRPACRARAPGRGGARRRSRAPGPRGSAGRWTGKLMWVVPLGRPPKNSTRPRGAAISIACSWAHVARAGHDHHVGADVLGGRAHGRDAVGVRVST